MLAGYVDAAYSDNVETARSTTGWLLKYGGAAVTHVFTEINLSLKLFLRRSTCH